MARIRGKGTVGKRDFGMASEGLGLRRGEGKEGGRDGGEKGMSV